jgi:aminopeptidase N
MRTDTPPTVHRSSYQPFPYRISHVDLQFDLDPEKTTVITTLNVQRTAGSPVPLVLNGDSLELVEICLDETALQPGSYQLGESELTLHPDAEHFTLRITSTCSPIHNTALMGLYVSGDKLFTQCEAEGFRRITWFPDRPDVMSRYTVTLRADKSRFPLLLSNGNLVGQCDLPEGRHEARWEDPHPKPCYLFALVAGDFECRERTVHTRSGRPVLLQVYSDRGTLDKTAWAMDCLERSLTWDEQRFGLELDLDRFMIVAARDFNMGAMENKGLNIFNSAYVLADKDTATDAVYRAIEAVIGHEYFHNWTGNRVTCRDWFQLSLKEGLTVFRDQEFSADMLAAGANDAQAQSARAVKRIDDVSALRIAQFPEDAGPMAHPIRPESYQEIANFYTATIYEKGAEVIRMQHTLLGEEGFQAGIKEYFRRHDGQAVTCDDFIDAMESVYREQNQGKDMSVFRRWYAQAGTPRVTVSHRYAPDTHTSTLTLSQSCPPVGVEKRREPSGHKAPLHIPVAIGMLDSSGKPLHISCNGEHRQTVLLELTSESQTWVFQDIPETPVLSLLRNFSAPVIIDYPRHDNELALLAAHDPEPFARWEAGQELATRQLLALARQFADGNTSPGPDATVFAAWERLARDPHLTPAYRARVLALPSDKEILEKTQPMDPVSVVNASRLMRSEMGRRLATGWLDLYQDACAHTRDDYSPDPVSAGWRSLKNLSLTRLMEAAHPQAADLAQAQYHNAGNMTDRLGGLSALLLGESDAGQAALDHFYEQWQHDALVMDKWFALQATARHTTVNTVRALMLHPAFSLRNPNRARSLLFQFCMNNMAGVHNPEGYEFWAEQVIALDGINPEIAARLARAFDNWSRYVPRHRDAMKSALEHIQQQSTLSRNVSEIVSKALTL